MCTGSDMDQENLIQESFTLMETGVMSVRKALRLILLHRAVSTNSPRETSASLMLELTTVLWLHVEMKLNLLEKVNKPSAFGKIKCNFIFIDRI